MAEATPAPLFARNYIDISRMLLWGDNDNAKAKLVFSFRDGNPRFTVYTGVPGKDGVLSFPSDPATMAYILTTLQDAAKLEPGSKQQIQSLATVYNNDKPTTEKRVSATLFFGKTKDGLVYISVIMEGKPKIAFTFKPSPYHVFKDAEGNTIPDGVVSSKLASSVANVWLNILSMTLQQYTNEEYRTVRKPTPIKGNSGPANPGGSGGIDQLDELVL